MFFDILTYFDQRFKMLKQKVISLLLPHKADFYQKSTTRNARFLPLVSTEIGGILFSRKPNSSRRFSLQKPISSPCTKPKKPIRRAPPTAASLLKKPQSPKSRVVRVQSFSFPSAPFEPRRPSRAKLSLSGRCGQTAKKSCRSLGWIRSSGGTSRGESRPGVGCDIQRAPRETATAHLQGGNFQRER